LRRAGIHDVEDPEFVDPLYEATYRIAGSVLSYLDSVLNSIDLSNRSIRIKIRFVNAPHLFIFTEAITSLYTGFSSNTVQRLSESFDELSKAVSKLIRRGADVVFSFTLLGLYHPAKYVAREGSGISDVKLVDLDEFGIIAVAKMDADMFGEVRALYSMSPSRLVTLSDLVNTVIAGKAYLKAVKIAKNLVVDGERRNLDVIPLYAGGDDITLYGKWSPRSVLCKRAEQRHQVHSTTPITIDRHFNRGRKGAPPATLPLCSPPVRGVRKECESLLHHRSALYSALPK
jgi:hypothetical protein